MVYIKTEVTPADIQMQYCHQGTLHQWLTRTDRVICARSALHIFRQAVQGVAHIHTHCVIHRDLKPPNVCHIPHSFIHSFFSLLPSLTHAQILISADGVVKIGDFGLSTGGMVDTVAVPLSPTDKFNRSHTTGVGSPLYCSPEQLLGERYDAKVDVSLLLFLSFVFLFFDRWHIFALGVILYEMFHIFSTQMERVSLITQLRDGFIGEQTKGKQDNKE